MTEDWKNGGFGLYIHWPFCQSKCPYCDFNSHVASKIDQEQWLKAYLAELDRYAALTNGRVLNTVFFGGGTPSLMDPDVVHAILDRVQRLWPMANDPEITLEANPGSVEAGRFRAYAQAGVSRVSMGIQALNDTDLKRLGRLHSVGEAKKAFEIARSCFDRVSFDLIYARQDQSLAEWQAELRSALSMAVDHLSLYQLTIEDGTAFGDRHEKGKLKGLPDDDRAADMYFATQEICEASGFPAYEVSNHAAPGSESRHNLIYWRYGDYIGIGPGAHGRLTLSSVRYATETWKAPQKWLQAIEMGSGESSRASLTGKEQANEYLLMGLRINEGIDPGRILDMSRQSLNKDTLDYLQDIGMIEQGERISVTRQGRPVLNSIIRELLLD